MCSASNVLAVSCGSRTSNAAASREGSRVGPPGVGRAAGPVTPDTILRWYRELIAAKDDGTARCGAGRPGAASSLRELVVRFATENPPWGYTGIRHVLGSLGHVLGRNTVKRIPLEHGLEPAPSLGRRMPWNTFLKAYLGSIAATDFFTVEALARLGALLRPLRHRPRDAARPDRRHRSPALWRLDEAGRPQPQRPHRGVPPGQAPPHPRSRSSGSSIFVICSGSSLSTTTRAVPLGHWDKADPSTTVPECRQRDPGRDSLPSRWTTQFLFP